MCQKRRKKASDIMNNSKVNLSPYKQTGVSAALAHVNAACRKEINVTLHLQSLPHWPLYSSF